jgi:hypothetical protein
MFPHSVLLLALALALANYTVALKYGGSTVPAYSKRDYFAGHRLNIGDEQDKHRFMNDFDGKLPCVLKGVFSKVDNDNWCEEMRSKLGEIMIEYDSRSHEQEVTLDTYECTLNEYLGALGDNSNHLYSMYFISEDILQLEEARTLTSSLQLPSATFGDKGDLFSHFPESIRPMEALIIGGVGSRSFLHADPYEWTGWNYCMEGVKLWTFLPPETEANARSEHSDGELGFLKTRRVETNAWGEYNIAAGWQSDIDLYHRVLSPQDATSPLNRHISKVVMPAAAGTLVPPFFASSDPVLEHQDDLWPVDDVNMNESDDTCDGNDDVSGEDAPSLVSGAVQIVQQAGETVIIPPGWLHQVYSLSPSIAVSGQYCNDNNIEGVLRHTMDWSNTCGQREEEARQQEQAMKKERDARQKGEESILDEFYEEGSDDSSSSAANSSEEATITGAVTLSTGLHDREYSEIVPELIRAALLARYRRPSVAQEVYDELYLDV